MLDMNRVHLFTDIEMLINMKNISRSTSYNKKHLPCRERSCKDSPRLVIFTRVEVVAFSALLNLCFQNYTKNINKKSINILIP